MRPLSSRPTDPAGDRRRPATRPRAAPPAPVRPVVEGLEGRLLFHEGHDHSLFAGEVASGAVPWATSPVQAPGAAPVVDAPAEPIPPAPPPAVLEPAAAAASTVRINAGGGAFTDAKGRAWAADAYFSGTTTVRADAYDVAKTTDDALYYTRRVGLDFRYAVPVVNGTYAVTLLFADSDNTAAGLRQFDVTAEGKTVLSKFDIAAAGGGRAAVSRTFSVAVADGKLDLGFVHVLRNATVSAIEVVPAGTPAPTPTPTPVPTPTPTPVPTPTPTPTPAPSTFTKVNWTTAAPSPVSRAESLSAVVDGKIYVFGGFIKDANGEGPATRSDVYDPAANTWRQIASLPRALTHVGVAVDGHDVYLVGGYYGTKPGTYAQVWGTKEVWRYNIDTNTYTALPALPAAYAGGGAAVVGRKLHYFGGFDLSRADVNVHLVLDLDHPSAGWQPAAKMLLSTNHMGAVTYNGKIYAVGGQTGHDEGLATQSAVQVYDPATNGWTAVAPLPGGRSHIAAATFVAGGRIYVIAGESANGVRTSTVYAYNPATNVWQTLTALPAARFSGVGAMVNGKLYYTTGGSNVTYVGTPLG